MQKKYNDVWNGIKDKIKEVSSDEYDYEKDYMKIKINSDNNLLLNKPLKFHNMTIIIRCVFNEGGKCNPQRFKCIKKCWLCFIKFFYNFFFVIYKYEWESLI